MSHHVSEGEWFSSGCGVRGSSHSTLGDCPLLASWNGASPPPQWCQLLCTAVSFLCPSRSRGAGALQQLTFLLTRAVCCLWKAEADGADSLGLNDTCVLPASPLPPAQGPAIMSAQPHEGSWLLWGSVRLEVSPMGWFLLRPLATFDLQLF